MKEKPYILIVDDDPDILDGILMILETQPYKLETARDGKKCMELVENEVPDLLILDLLMPKMDGFAVCKELQDPRWSKYRNIPILILTSVREEASRRRYELETGLELDVDDYVEKPMSPDVLLERVGKLIKKKDRG